MKSALILPLFWFILGMPRADAQEPNLIPNSSFEEFSGVPLGWFYNGSQFTRLVKYWCSPTLASPDAFGPGIIVPKHWKKKGFGKIEAQDGNAMAGLTLYGCADGKPHCREYIQIQLNESLVVGQKYAVKYWLAHLDQSLYIDKIGIYFSKGALKQDDDKVIHGGAQVYCKNIVRPESGEWKQIEKSFIADQEYNYLTLGNFFADNENEVNRESASYEFAYYYIDNIELRKLPPIIEQELPDDDLTKQELEVGKKIQLRNIYFDLDKSELLPRSFVELNKLRGILSEHPNMTIEVHGHTDIQGESDYNLDLSIQRSQAVSRFLVENGIDSSRIDFKGFGSNQPIANNGDESGRQLNRRVEILITAL